MAGTSSFIDPNYPTIWSDYRFNNIQMLSDLADNDNNLITAKNIRNSIWTLSNKIDDVQIIASQALTENNYIRSTPTTMAVGNAVIGSTFSGTVQDALDKILYKYSKQVNFISVQQGLAQGNSIRLQYGSPLLVNLYWSVTKYSENLESITVNGIPYTPLDLSMYWGVSQSGTQSALGTYSSAFTSDLVRISQTQNLTMSTSDGTTLINTTASVVWCNNVYWGRLTTAQAGVLSLLVKNAVSPSRVAIVSGKITNSVVIGLTGSGFSTGRSLSLDYLNGGLDYTVNGSGGFICFAWPQAFERLKAPIFSENGVGGTFYTKIKNMVITNELGFGGITYSVWLSNTTKNALTIKIT